MKPASWSFSSLSTHHNCPKQYHHKYVLKDLPPEEKSPEMLWGTFVHETFDKYLSTKPKGLSDMAASKSGFELPPDLLIHKPYLDTLLQKPGVLTTERKVALKSKPFGPCNFFDKAVWWRGIIDCTVVEHDEGRALIADYKTGKKKDEWDQLAMSAIHVFSEFPFVNLINAQFYWAVDQTVTKKVWGRGEMDELIGMFLPKLDAFVTSFQTETFTPKQSGLCRGWCPVKTCQFWEPKKDRRR